MTLGNVDGVCECMVNIGLIIGMVILFHGIEMLGRLRGSSKCCVPECREGKGIW